MRKTHYLVELSDCLQDKETQVIANRLAELLTYHQIPLQMREKILGVHHHVTQSKKNGASSDYHWLRMRPVYLNQLVKDLAKDFPEVVTVAVNTNQQKTSEIYGEKTEIIWGQERDQEGVLGL